MSMSFPPMASQYESDKSLSMDNLASKAATVALGWKLMSDAW